MSSVLEIEKAIEALQPEDFFQLAAWFDEKRKQEVDDRFEKAIRAGKFDGMAEQALKDAAAGRCVPLDEFLDRS